MTAFRPGDRAHLKHHARTRATTGTVVNAERFAGGHVFVRWDDNQAVTSHLPQHLELVGEPMSKRTDFLDADGSPMTIEGRADHKNWAIKFASTYREFTPEDAPALALAILEAAGVKACAKEFGATAGTMAQLEDIAWALADYSNAKALEAEQAADREALEGEALHLCRIMWDNPDQAWTPMSPEAKAKWLKMARTARTLHGVTK